MPGFCACVRSSNAAGTNHEHDQPSHLKLKDAGVPEYLNGPHFAAPESRYCPAGALLLGLQLGVLPGLSMSQMSQLFVAAGTALCLCGFTDCST